MWVFGNDTKDKVLHSGLFGLVLAGSLLVEGCLTSPAEPIGTDPGRLTPGYVTGKVIDAQGRALPGASIYIDNTLLYNSNLPGNTDENGLYRIKTENGSWRATAEILRTYNGKQYRLDLKPDNIDAFAGDDGAVRNFQWNLSGEKPGYPGAFYGGSVDVANEPGKGPYDTENIEFTFTPVGPLIDGSTGKTLVFRYDTHYGRIPDVPIGRYKITAIYKPTNTKLKLRNRVDGTYANDGSVMMDFYGAEPYWSCTNCMFLEYKEP